MRRLSLILLGYVLLASSTCLSMAVCPPVIASFAPVLTLAPTHFEDLDIPDLEEPFVSADGRYFLSTAADGLVTIYDWAARRRGGFRREERAHEKVVDSQSKIVRQLDLEGRVQSWDFSGRLVSEFRLISGWLPHAHFDPTGMLLVEQYEPSEITEEALEKKEEMLTQPLTPERLMALAQAGMAPRRPDFRPRHLRVLDARTGALVAELNPHVGEIRDTVFTPDGSLVATASRAGVVRVEKLSDGKLLFEKKLKEKVNIKISPDGKLLFATGKNSSYVYRISDSVLMMESSQILNAEFVPGRTNELLLHGWSNFAMHVRVQESRIKGKAAPVIPLGSIFHELGQVTSSVLSSDGKYAAIEFSDGKLILFELETKSALAELTGIGEALLGNDIHFTANNRGLVRIDHDGQLQFWDLSNLPTATGNLQSSVDGTLWIGNRLRDDVPSTLLVPAEPTSTP